VILYLPIEGEAIRETDIYSDDYGIDSTASDIIPGIIISGSFKVTMLYKINH